ncbi:MAG: copper chaperone CopZ [Synergistaceae bacterium]|jgi:copper chaperone|nr:copper chaperone CopZ [Synergistaceae bacterium]
METVVLNVDGMSCEHCVKAVKKAVGALDGAKEVDVDLASKTVSVSFDGAKTNVGEIKDAIEDQGYDVVTNR